MNVKYEYSHYEDGVFYYRLTLPNGRSPMRGRKAATREEALELLKRDTPRILRGLEEMDKGYQTREIEVPDEPKEPKKLRIVPKSAYNV